MQFDKTETLRNLKNLQETIGEWYDLYKDMGCNFDFRDRCFEDLLFVTGLIDDIECDRITEFPMVERTNMMSGETFLEDEDTPHYCSPSSETYWSM